MLCHNKLALTQACVESILKWSGSDYELLITDNASTDGTQHWLAALADKQPRVHVITNRENKGFKEPHEHALELAKGEFFILLNNDMVVCEEWLERLTEPFAGDPKLAITGVAGTCCTIAGNLTGQPLGWEKRTEPEYVEGSCLCIPTGLARKIGLFAKWLDFIYWEDTELSIRIREMGYTIKHVQVDMKHDKPGSTSNTVPRCQEALKANTEQMKARYNWYWKRRELKRRILVRRLGAHGDVLLATPALQSLHERYPLAEIGVVTKCPSMLKGIGWLSTATKNRNYYDEFHDLDLAYEKRSDLHIVDAFALALGVSVTRKWQMLMVASEADLAWAERVARGTKLALLHPGPSCWPGKNWVLDEDGGQDRSRWMALVEVLRKKGYTVMTVGDGQGLNVASDLHLGGCTTPQQLYALCQKASLFVGIDSMPQHVASAANTPSVVLFGPTNPRVIVRPTPRIVAVQADQAKVPCVGEHGRRTKPVTQAPCSGLCMKAITLGMVTSAIDRVEAICR